jgi:hypothetical protein
MQDLTRIGILTRRALLAAAAAVFLAATPVAAGPVVVELYTSQGCNTCPPADKLLGELKRRDDVLALSIHVNYWDYLGWTDPFATQVGTDRQRDYARPLRQRYVYTPQMVIDGRAHVAGHKRAKVEGLIAAAKARRGADLPLRFVENADGEMTVSIPASDFRGEAEVMMALYDDAHSTPIRRGENAGRTLTYSNVVRELVPIGTYRGEAIELDLPMSEDGGNERDGCAILVQESGLGPILGAAKIDLRQ